VLVCACAESACQYLEGSMRAHKRVAYAHSWLQQIGIESERLQFVHLPPMDGDALNKALDAFTARLESFENVPPVAKIQAG
jgi:coenzyme F420-reducing hydrogenase delta subunit